MDTSTSKQNTYIYMYTYICIYTCFTYLFGYPYLYIYISLCIYSFQKFKTRNQNDINTRKPQAICTYTKTEKPPHGNVDRRGQWNRSLVNPFMCGVCLSSVLQLQKKSACELAKICSTESILLLNSCHSPSKTMLLAKKCLATPSFTKCKQSERNIRSGVSEYGTI